ncbi:nuclear transport factor 2 family protein [Streptomyces sp. NPDC002769]|uniref:nuclear transport factor 2 family protein n=1 Tax=Streptomyces sp. NPDC002769 TaxID=3154542 RepID=UPI0033219538
MATREVVEKFLGLLGAGDPDAVAKVFAEVIDWYVPGSDQLPWTGRRTTPAEVADYLRVLGENIVPEENVDKIEALIVEGEHAVLLREFTRTARSTGRVYEMPIAMHFQVTDDKISKLYLYEDTAKVAQAYAQ